MEKALYVEHVLDLALVEQGLRAGRGVDDDVQSLRLGPEVVGELQSDTLQLLIGKASGQPDAVLRELVQVKDGLQRDTTDAARYEEQRNSNCDNHGRHDPNRKDNRLQQSGDVIQSVL